jgi:Protein of unknown function (DUF3788)
VFTNAFIGKSKPPEPEELAAALGPQAMALWDRLLAEVALPAFAFAFEWNRSSTKSGWAMRLKRGDRNIVYLSPGDGMFLASFALGDRAMEAARREAKFPKAVLEMFAAARRYAEGTAVRIEVSKAADVDTVKKLVAIKLAH